MDRSGTGGDRHGSRTERPAPERLSAADASNVVMDARDQVNAVLLAGVLGVGGFVSAGGRLDLDRLRADIAARLRDPASPGLGRLAQRVRVGRRVMEWEPCAPELGWHVRLVEPVAGEQGLADLAATLMTVPLPLDRPLWELLVVPGAGPDGPGSRPSRAMSASGSRRCPMGDAWGSPSTPTQMP